MTERVSRLQAKLEAAIRNAVDRQDADCHRADLAAQFARSGHVVESEAIIADLRARYETISHERVIPWINFAEGCIDLECGRGEAALTKFRRAHALAAAVKLPLAAFAAATLAHWYWNRLEVDVAVKYAKEALDLATSDDHRTLCRVSMVIAEMLAMSRLEGEAEPWFICTRRYAMLAGDDLAIRALVCNMSVVQIVLLRQAKCEGQASGERLNRVKATVQSSIELDSLFEFPADDVGSLPRASFMSDTGKFGEALRIYEARMNSAKMASASRQRGPWLADVAWCLVNLNRHDDAKPIALEAADAITPQTQIDDRAAMHSRLALVFAALGDAETAAAHQLKADDCWQQYRDFQDRCAALCEPFLNAAGGAAR